MNPAEMLTSKITAGFSFNDVIIPMWVWAIILIAIILFLAYHGYRWGVGEVKTTEKEVQEAAAATAAHERARALSASTTARAQSGVERDHRKLLQRRMAADRAAERAWQGGER